MFATQYTAQVIGGTPESCGYTWNSVGGYWVGPSGEILYPSQAPASWAQYQGTDFSSVMSMMMMMMVLGMMMPMMKRMMQA